MVALRLGSDWTWCQYSGSWLSEPATVEVDLTGLSCADTPEDRSDVRGVMIWFNGGEHSIDNVRVW